MAITRFQPQATKLSTILYECDICGGLHPWDWDGDCRDDANRFGDPSEYANRHGLNEDGIEVRSMDERFAVDGL